MTDEEFYAMIERSMEDVRCGRVTSAEDVFAELEKEFAAQMETVIEK